MEGLNQHAANFLFHVKEIPEKQEKPSRENSATHIPFDDLSDKITSAPITSKELNHDYSVAKIYKTINGKRLGFPDHIYPSFIKFTTHLSSLPLFSNLATQDFILEETFNWLIESFQASRINLELIPYLLNCIDEKTEARTFHFPVLNLIIEKSFQIGNCNFQFFTKEYFDQFYKDSGQDGHSKDEYDKLFSRYCGKVFITCMAKAESAKAEELAFIEASLAMDIFRLFSPAVVFPTKIFMVDLEKRININFSSDHLSESTNGERKIYISKKANNEPFYYSQKMLHSSMQGGLAVFSDFIRNKKTDELYKLILHSISFYSIALSNPDLHLRISHLIMIFEGLLLEEGKVYKMQEKTKARLSKLMFGKDSKSCTMLDDVMIAMYEVRHQITHKGNRLPIDKIKLSQLQIILVEFGKKLIVLNRNIKSKTQLIDYIESMN